MKDLVIVATVLLVVGVLLGNFLAPGFVATVIFGLFFTLAGLFAGVVFLHWLADTPDKAARLPATFVSIICVCVCVLTVIFRWS